MRRFVELYLDEDVSVLLSDLLRSRGFKVTTTRDARMLGKGDREQLDYATSRGSVLLTHNRVHFEKLHNDHLKAGKKYNGIIVARRAPERTILRRLLKILNYITPEEMQNQLKYI